MDDHHAKRVPFLEWGHVVSTVEDPALGQKISSTRRFIAGSWVGQSVFVLMMLAFAAGLFLIPFEEVKAFSRFVLRLVY